MNDRESTGRCLAPRSLRTSLCLQFEAWKIANGCAFLTVVAMRLEPPDKDKRRRLYEILNLSERSLKSICEQVVEIYLEMENHDRLIVDLAHKGWITAQLAARRARAVDRGADHPAQGDAKRPRAAATPPR